MSDFKPLDNVTERTVTYCVNTSDTRWNFKKTTINRIFPLIVPVWKVPGRLTGEIWTTQMGGGTLMWVCGAAGTPAPV